MTEKVQLSRRSFVAANAAVAAAAAVPAVASASTAPVASKAMPTNWETVTLSDPSNLQQIEVYPVPALLFHQQLLLRSWHFQNSACRPNLFI